MAGTGDMSVGSGYTPDPSVMDKINKEIADKMNHAVEEATARTEAAIKINDAIDAQKENVENVMKEAAGEPGVKKDSIISHGAEVIKTPQLQEALRGLGLSEHEIDEKCKSAAENIYNDMIGNKLINPDNQLQDPFSIRIGEKKRLDVADVNEREKYANISKIIQGIEDKARAVMNEGEGVVDKALNDLIADKVKGTVHVPTTPAELKQEFTTKYQKLTEEYKKEFAEAKNSDPPNYDKMAVLKQKYFIDRTNLSNEYKTQLNLLRRPTTQAELQHKFMTKALDLQNNYATKFEELKLTNPPDLSTQLADLQNELSNKMHLLQNEYIKELSQTTATQTGTQALYDNFQAKKEKLLSDFDDQSKKLLAKNPPDYAGLKALQTTLEKNISDLDTEYHSNLLKLSYLNQFAPGLEGLDENQRARLNDAFAHAVNAADSLKGLDADKKAGLDAADMKAKLDAFIKKANEENQDFDVNARG